MYEAIRYYTSSKDEDDIKKKEEELKFSGQSFQYNINWWGYSWFDLLWNFIGTIGGVGLNYVYNKGKIENLLNDGACKIENFFKSK